MINRDTADFIYNLLFEISFFAIVPYMIAHNVQPLGRLCVSAKSVRTLITAGKNSNSHQSAIVLDLAGYCRNRNLPYKATSTRDDPIFRAHSRSLQIVFLLPNAV